MPTVHRAGQGPSPVAARGEEPAGAEGLLDLRLLPDHRVSPYAAPARAANLAGLPPAYLAVGDLDLFIDEDIEYAQRLQQAGVPTELHVYPGGSHAFESYAPGSALARRFVQDRDGTLRRAFGA